ncbi:hypothetical protein DPV78_012942, partial [Talaromyces pinophilus]
FEDPNPLAAFRSSDYVTIQCDIAIIGTSWAGLATAYHMLLDTNFERTTLLNIVLLGARHACTGATGHNAEKELCIPAASLWLYKFVTTLLSSILTLSGILYTKTNVTKVEESHNKTTLTISRGDTQVISACGLILLSFLEEQIGLMNIQWIGLNGGISTDKMTLANNPAAEHFDSIMATHLHG